MALLTVMLWSPGFHNEANLRADDTYQGDKCRARVLNLLLSHTIMERGDRRHMKV